MVGGCIDSFIYGEQRSGFRDYLEALLTLDVTSLLRVGVMWAC